ncbi:MAG TPA: methyltransferase domain-containing protein [Candidatus Thermoplasmatota archaeon]|nr:methyltransferase domain-containing protein [Candidatus Thermoplasmatota archaeon]
MARAYDEVVTPRFAPFSEAALEATKLAPGERALDVASGPGALALAAARAGARVVATDFAPAMVERLRERADREKLEVDAREMDGHALRFDDASFDAAYCVFGLMFFHDRVGALREMRRVLRPGGRVGIVTWSTPERSGFFGLFAQAFERALPDLPPAAEPPTPFSMGDPELVERVLREAGFASVKARRVVREMDLGSAQRAWADFTTTNPVVPAMLAHVGEENVPRLRRALEDVFRERERGGTVRVDAEAVLATAQR